MGKHEPSQWCRDCFRLIPKGGWKPSAWENITKTCRTCTNTYKQTLRNPEFKEQQRQLKAEIQRAIQLEKDELRKECLAVKKQCREERKIERAEYMRFRSCALTIGVDPDETWAAYQAHDKRCDICDRHEDELNHTRLFIDHCHITGMFRGFLCRDCNTAIGLLQDNPDTISAALKYVETR